MHRRFATTTTRKQTSLGGVWDFGSDPGDVGLDARWYEEFPDHAVGAQVPGVWNTLPAYETYEGVGWFRTRFTVGQCTAAVLHLAAVTHQANLWLDGEPLGEHYGGFLPFAFPVSPIQAGEHEVVVRVDNTYDDHTTLPSAHLECFHYGGIPRPVWVDEVQGPGFIARLRLAPACLDGECVLRVRAELANLSDRPLRDTWTLYLDERPIGTQTVHLGPLSTEVLLFSERIPHVHLWSPESPHLYNARFSFAGDDRVERVGFREIRVEGSRVLLNGQPLRLRGVNRLEDHPDWGSALPEAAVAHDLSLLQGLHANGLRGAHFPNDQRLLDLCDERGILFMAEIPAWGLSEEQLSQDILLDRASAMLWAMIERDVNHPCIWAWSLMSDCATDTLQGRVALEHLVETAREADPTRLVTYTTSKGRRDVSYGLVDVACISAMDLPAAAWRGLLEGVRAVIGHQPLMVTEFGAPAIYGQHAAQDGAPGSEEQQATAVAEAVRVLLRRDDLLGFLVWQLCDSRVSACAQPQQYTAYDWHGLVDAYRRPKMAYRTLADLLANTVS